ncbi:MAG TPA: molybdopterin cofactor-binding domain-containing protein, partial [Candidatus Binatia bacterium]|nr:molybdopterin cofactor-binding domain-containing protein [Candidatus Binatia bacterium]
MTTEHSPNGLIGASIRRVEDPILVAGKGCYVDDIQLPGMLYLAFLRTTYPHAKIVSIDTSAARSMAGVVTVLTGEDVKDLNIPAAPMISGQKIPPHPVLARGVVHEAGVAVAAVVAQSRALAQDAANAIEVEYESLPSVTDAEEALEPGAPLAREELDNNICYVATKKGGDVDKAFAQAEHICRMHIASPRQVALAIEPRGIVVKPEPMGQGMVLWLSAQAPHRVRGDLATALAYPEHKIRLIAPDVGGGFGSKGPLYREYVLACHLALKLGRPIKWIATRSEDFVTTIQGRDQAMTSELALKKDGTMLGLKVRVVANLGAYLYSSTA